MNSLSVGQSLSLIMVTMIHLRTVDLRTEQAFLLPHLKSSRSLLVNEWNTHTEF